MDSAKYLQIHRYFLGKSGSDDADTYVCWCYCCWCNEVILLAAFQHYHESVKSLLVGVMKVGRKFPITVLIYKASLCPPTLVKPFAVLCSVIASEGLTSWC